MMGHLARMALHHGIALLHYGRHGLPFARCRCPTSLANLSLLRLAAANLNWQRARFDTALSCIQLLRAQLSFIGGEVCPTAMTCLSVQ